MTRGGSYDCFENESVVWDKSADKDCFEVIYYLRIGEDDLNQLVQPRAACCLEGSVRPSKLFVIIV